MVLFSLTFGNETSLNRKDFLVRILERGIKNASNKQINNARYYQNLW